MATADRLSDVFAKNPVGDGTFVCTEGSERSVKEVAGTLLISDRAHRCVITRERDNNVQL